MVFLRTKTLYSHVIYTFLVLHSAIDLDERLSYVTAATITSNGLASLLNQTGAGPRGHDSVEVRNFDQGWSARAQKSGARSAYPLSSLTALGDAFGLLNRFNIFKDQEATRYLVVANQEDYVSSTPVSTPQVETLATELEPELSFPTLELQDSESKTRRTKQNSISDAERSPVIMVPGYGGSRLEAKLDKPSVVRYFCDRKSDWSDIWIRVKLLLPYMIDCLIDNLRLEFDQATNTTRNPPGVEIRVKNATHISSVEYLHHLPLSGFAYFAPIVDRLVDSLGYTRQVDILGAPYDFRKAPNELADYFVQLRETSEQTYHANGMRSVSYVCHSMGCNNMLYFLQRQPKSWKDKYVKRLISVAAPWGGSLSALRAAALGDDLGMPYLFSESKLIQVQRSLPSTIFLFPHEKVFAGTPLIKSFVDPTKIRSEQTNSNQTYSLEQKFYTTQNFETFFNDIAHPDGYRMWLTTKDLLGSIEAPGVEVWCIVGVGQKTFGRMEYSAEFPDSDYLELYDDGDGTVNIQSSSYCKRWSEEQKKPVHYMELDVGHIEILKDPRFLDLIRSVVAGELSTEADLVSPSN